MKRPKLEPLAIGRSQTTPTCPTCGRRPSERHSAKWRVTCRDPIHDLADRAEAMRDALERYRQFADDIMEAVWESGGVDGGWLQDHAEEGGIIVKVPGGFNPSKHNDWGGVCEPGDPFYMLEELAALRGEEASGE